MRRGGLQRLHTKPVNMDELVRVVQTSVGGKTELADSPGEASATARVDFARSAIQSTLPMDDPEIRELIAEFAATIPERIDAIEKALNMMDYNTIANLAHALKGAGGTAGFQCLTDVSLRIEESAAERHAEGIGGMLHELRSINERIVV